MSEEMHTNDLIDKICRVIMDYCTDKKENAKPSAFQAANTTIEQSVIAETPVVPVLYPNIIFDLNNEYDPVSSTFTPKHLEYIPLLQVLFFHLV